MDTISREERSKLMSRVRSSGNKSTELRMIQQFRKLHIKGWRRNQAIFGHPDFVFPKRKVVVFVDGDFWHGHPRLGRIPKSNSAFWKAKIEANKARDRKVNRVLKKAGWNVIRIWESEIEKPSMQCKLQVVNEYHI